jgi:hypothetical protein
LKEGSVRKHDSPTKEEESWRIITNNEIPYFPAYKMHHDFFVGNFRKK